VVVVGVVVGVVLSVDVVVVLVVVDGIRQDNETFLNRSANSLNLSTVKTVRGGGDDAIPTNSTMLILEPIPTAENAINTTHCSLIDKHT